MRLAGVPTIVACLTALSAAPAHAATDEDQIRAVLNGMNTSYNQSDFDAFATNVCVGMRQAAGYETAWYASRNSDGPTRITVNSIDVAGGPSPHAIANVRFQAANRQDAKTIDMDFLLEGNQWKACRSHPTRSV